MMVESERKEIIEVFDTIAEEFSRSRRRVWKSLEEAGPFEGEIILDLGAGSGRNSKFLVERGAAFVVAADISSEMLKVLMSNLKRDYWSFVEPVRCDALYLPFSPSAFDKVIFVATIHHIPGNLSKLRALQEVKRVLKRNGAILITAWALIQLRFLRRLPAMIMNWLKGREFGDIYIPWGKKKRFYHLFTVKELRSLVKDAGFCVEKAYGEKVSSRIFAENCVVLARKV
ncbi:MAG: class I SAM-dependent methyltransferase [Candidatus Methanomethyliales bacterium]|nr:class I SAM-dependent methyltransferase [Candidatus Methanomethylicales archaeon]